MKTIKFNARDLEVWNGLRDLSERIDLISPTKLGLHLGFTYNTASSKCNRSLKKFVKENVVIRSIGGKYKIICRDFNIKHTQIVKSAD